MATSNYFGLLGKKKGSGNPAAELILNNLSLQRGGILHAPKQAEPAKGQTPPLTRK